MQLLEVCILNFSLLTTRPLSSKEASLCCGEAGEKEKESAQGIPVVPDALSIFSIIAIFIGIPCGSLCGRESYQTSTGDEANCLHNSIVLWQSAFLVSVFLVVQLLLGNA